VTNRPFTQKNGQSRLRLVTALLKEYHEDWITGRRYLRMEPLSERRTSEQVTDDVPAAA